MVSRAALKGGVFGQEAGFEGKGESLQRSETSILEKDLKCLLNEIISSKLHN